ncbi:unnamed protein product, partial [Mesorhabditis spiculigera]
MRLIALTAILIVAAAMATPLSEVFKHLQMKQNEIRQKQLLDFIAKNVPEGLDQPNPKIAEYETFKSDKMSNFVNDGLGHLQFRQFRRLRLGDVLSRHQAGI